nr:hypothetical protein [uncultured Allomuricauda sp.]|tara:strand:- start:103 stop:354 length:252 start_codon:yes stop_codon:yes gene_type:complete
MEKRSQEEEDFYQAKRIFANSVCTILERAGAEAAKRELERAFDDATLGHFPNELTKDGIYDTIISLERSQIVYRDEKYNKSWA